jgi:hypothetical protein
LVMLVMVKLMMVMRMDGRSLRTDALTAAAVRMLRSVRAAGSCRWRREGRRKRMGNRRRSQSSTRRSPVVMMERSGPGKRIRRSRNSASTGSRRRNSRIEAVTGGSGEFGRCSFGRPIPQDAVNTRNARRGPVSAHTFNFRNKNKIECGSLAKQIFDRHKTFLSSLRWKHWGSAHK